MIWLLTAALAAPPEQSWPEVAVLDGTALHWWAEAPSLELRHGASRTQLPLGTHCSAHLQHTAPDALVIETHCNGLEAWTRTRLTSGPGTLMVSDLGTRPGAEWVDADLAAAESWAEAERIAARYRHLVQRHGTPELREQIVARVWALALAEWQATATTNPVAAADDALRFAAALPSWESERPWDHHQRIALNAPMGQRANPERPIWLAPTPERVALATATAALLLRGGQPVAAADLLERVVLAEPSAAHWLAWGDAAWAAGDAAQAEQAYAEAAKLGATLTAERKARH